MERRVKDNLFKNKVIRNRCMLGSMCKKKTDKTILPGIISLWSQYCCNLSGGVALIVWFTMNGMCAKNKNIYAWRGQAIIEWSCRVISIVACCHGVKLCAHAAQDFRSQQNGSVTRMWRSCGVRPSHKERAIGVVHCKKEGMLLQPRCKKEGNVVAMNFNQERHTQVSTKFW